MWIIITSHLSTSNVCIECQCIHTYMALLSVLFRRTKVGMRTGRHGIYEQKEYTHDTNSWKQANRKGRCVGETKTITNGFKFLFLRSFVTCHERATVWLFHVEASQNYCVSHLNLNSRRSDGDEQCKCLVYNTILTWGQVQRGRDKSLVVGRHISIIRIWRSRRQTHAVLYSAYQNGGRCSAPGDCRSPRVAEDLERSLNVLHFYTKQRDETTTARGGKIPADVRRRPLGTL